MRLNWIFAAVRAIIDDLNEQARRGRPLAVDPNGSGLVHRMGMLDGVDQRLADEQAYGSGLFGGDGRLLPKTTDDFRVLGIGERA